jgi:citrate synthase
MAMNARSGTKAIRALKVSEKLQFSGCIYLLTVLPQPIVFRPIAVIPSRNYATSSEPDLKSTLKEIIPAKRELLKKVKAHSDKVIGEVKIENTLGGMR